MLIFPYLLRLFTLCPLIQMNRIMAHVVALIIIRIMTHVVALIIIRIMTHVVRCNDAMHILKVSRSLYNPPE